ncbi:MAG TPA: ABC transporter ATP-binding protein [Accumulibacter sp.]|uniref:ABC transporter ATP-binding protein n=1 Tax=Accumulibacter sp. TaxID=2053492 RepID=UPI00260EC793|nr:ABC transporter ATP-binding protein [Accumulibacter sp.]MDS4056011.1 ABC transporter ATP-binding protein [Accumulibacter sp.]HMV04085.1 ABC transporter ATP-binding protein [Accumulibacter sp.]HMW63554.1 ABC transporter ATP-binding protein [Accumulibacter sp.]HMW78928.1 ABC transporter ATP-binding protein [Accumulibacter sp.]HMX68254.1 ABC transporter ATP-binding protein [Accumulibacter sp.]
MSPDPDKTPVVRIERVFKDYLLGEQKVQALKGITLSFDPGVFLAIAGPSGSGKTTLLNLIGCIDTPTSGKIYINEQDVSGRTPDQLADLRAHTIGFIFQTFNLLPVLSAAENVEYPLLHRRDVSPAERQKRVAFFLDVVGLSKFANHRPSQLSGGQRQRVAIARALAIRPAIVLADEPTANLDHKTGEEILLLMKSINRSSLRTTFIFSTHDKRVIAKADRLVRIEDGEIALLGIRQRSQTRWSVVRRPPSDVHGDNQTDSQSTAESASPGENNNADAP